MVPTVPVPQRCLVEGGEHLNQNRSRRQPRRINRQNLLHRGGLHTYFLHENSDSRFRYGTGAQHKIYLVQTKNEESSAGTEGAAAAGPPSNSSDGGGMVLWVDETDLRGLQLLQSFQRQGVF